jgi:hypothetical protein
MATGGGVVMSTNPDEVDVSNVIVLLVDGTGPSVGMTLTGQWAARTTSGATS